MKFNLKINQLKENTTYQREEGGYVIVKGGDFFFADSLTAEFLPTTSLSLSDKFAISGESAPEGLRELLSKYVDDKSPSAKDRNHEKLLFKIVEEIEKLKVKPTEAKKTVKKK